MESLEIKTRIKEFIERIDKLPSVNLDIQDYAILAAYMPDILQDVNLFLEDVHFSGGHQVNTFIKLKHDIINSISEPQTNPFVLFCNREADSLHRLKEFCKFAS